jgi:hypothetical protein
MTHTIQLTTKQIEELIDGVAITITEINSELRTAKGRYKDYLEKTLVSYQGIYDVFDAALRENK